MILVDTSIWIDHLRSGDNALANALGGRTVLTHPFVIGEIALGNLRQRALVMTLLQGLPTARVATNVEALAFIETHKLSGTGIGLIDAHLLVSVKLTPVARLWARDRRLHEIAARMKLAADNVS